MEPINCIDYVLPEGAEVGCLPLTSIEKIDERRFKLPVTNVPFGVSDVVGVKIGQTSVLGVVYSILIHDTYSILELRWPVL